MKKMLVGFAIADAMGVPVEFKSRLELKSNPVVDMRGFGVWNKPPGTWSDDTSMTIATMESISRLGRIDLEDIMDNFTKWVTVGAFTVDGLFDVGHTTKKAIRNYRNGYGIQWCGVSSDRSNGNGSLMRMTPVFRFLHSKSPWTETEMNTIHNVSALTHAHILSQMCCGFYCLIANELLNGVDKFTAVANGLSKGLKYYYSTSIVYHKWLKRFGGLMDSNFKSMDISELSSSGYVLDSLECSIWLLLNTKSYKELILKAVNLGGDTDTTAAIAAGLGGIIYDYHDLPSTWKLRNREYLEELENAFLERVGIDETV